NALHSFVVSCSGDHRKHQSFPTRRSSDLESAQHLELHQPDAPGKGPALVGTSPAFRQVIELARKVASTYASVFLTGESGAGKELDRKSTRLNSSHVAISYADLCLQKKIGL